MTLERLILIKLSRWYLAGSKEGIGRKTRERLSVSTKALFGARGSGATVWNVRWTTVDFKEAEERNLKCFYHKNKTK